MFKYSIICSLLIAALGLLLGIYPEHFTTILSFLGCTAIKNTPSLFTPEELLKFNGIHQPEVYLAILGSVFDVSKGIKHYGPGGTYNIFVGKDASRSFVTGHFSISEISDDVTGLNHQELLSLKKWLQFYNKEYPRVGKLIGRYYDDNGKQTLYHKEMKKLIKLAENEKTDQRLEELKFPPCNVEWNAETGSRVWCTKRSGGIERNWVGVPRKLYEPGSGTYRCACVSEENQFLGNVQEYEDCNPSFDSCYVKT